MSHGEASMRRPRIKAEGGGYYHCMSRIIEHRHNVQEGRKGPLWEQRFKSVLVEGSQNALLTMAPVCTS